GSLGRGWLGHVSSPGALGVGFGSGRGPAPLVLNQSCDRSRPPRSTLIAVRLILPRRQVRSAGALPLDNLRLQTLEVLLLAQRPDDPEPDECGIGVPPDALRPLGVLYAPLGVRPAPRGATELVGIVVPRSAADHIGILLGVGQVDRTQSRLVDG